MTAATSYDRRVKKEARLLLKAARSLRRKAEARPNREGGPSAAKLDHLDGAARRVETALERGDLGAVREHLPRLDAIVDDVGAGHGKSTIREYVESIGVAIAIALVLRAFVVEAFKIPSSSMIPTMEIGDHIFVNKFIYGVRIPWTRTKLFEVRPPRRGEVIVFMNPCIPDKDYIKRIVAVAGDTVEMRCSVLYVNGVAQPAELVDGTKCSYWDYNERGGTWGHPACSRYRENLDGTVHDAFYDAGRPERDKARTDPDFDSDAGDFPEINHLGQADLPSCEAMGQEATEHPEPVGTILKTTDASMARGPCAPTMQYKVPPGYVFCMGDNRDNSNDSRKWGPVPVENIKGKALFIWWSSSDKSDGPRFSRMGKIVH
jgi:signal peptidase I